MVFCKKELLIMTKKHTIKERDIIPFGKHKGEVLLDVYARDPSYVEWLIKTATNYEIDLYSGWEEFVHDKMYPEDEKRLEDYFLFPDDGWYIVSFLGNGWDYGLYRQKFGKLIKLFDWYSTVAPFAYYRIPEYNPHSPFWGEMVDGGGGSIITICAYENGKEIEYKGIFGLTEGSSVSELHEYDLEEKHLKAVAYVPVLRLW